MHNILKQKISIIMMCCVLCFCMLFSACGSKKNNQTNQDTNGQSNFLQTDGEFTFTLPFTSSDGYNPYLTNNNITIQNSNLIFTSLFYIAPDFSLQGGACKSIDVLGNIATITVDTTRQYADGSYFNAADVTASILAAQQSAAFGGRFAHVTEVSSEGSTVTVTLDAPDGMFGYLLDIPIMKASETQSAKPTASGRYTYSQNGLTKSDYCTAKLPFNDINLIELSGYDAISGSLAIGTIDLYASESETDAYGLNVAHQTYYKMNNLIFLGINGTTYEGFTGAYSSQNLLKFADGRKAISELLDRQSIIEKAFYSRAYAATGAFNPAYPGMLQTDNISANAETQAAEQKLEAMGFKKDLDGYYYDSAKKKLSLRLLCYTGNSYKRYASTLIQSQLASYGIEVIIDETDNFDEYKQKIANGNFDMYIGEVKLYNNMDMSPFLSENGALRPYLAISDNLATAYSTFLSDKSTYSDYEAAFAAEMPYIPLLWRSGVVSYTKSADGLVSTVSDIFYGLSDIIIA